MSLVARCWKTTRADRARARAHARGRGRDMVVGVLCLILALLFGVKQFTSPRKLGDPRYLQWNDK